VINHDVRGVEISVDDFFLVVHVSQNRQQADE
jgi:hypothetical protein